jgi:hypothetical protein
LGVKRVPCPFEKDLVALHFRRAESFFSIVRVIVANGG